MTFVNPQDILHIFEVLKTAPFEYILIRNINAELPNALRRGKDIDLLIRSVNETQVRDMLTRQHYHEIEHPHCRDTYLYGAEPCIMMRHDAKAILFDVHFQLVCRSLNAGEWVPLDQAVQQSAWQNRRWVQDGQFAYWALSEEEEFVTLVTRSMFDKRAFEPGYVQRISALWNVINKEDVERKLRLVFFKYTPHLLAHIARGDYHSLPHHHMTFAEY